MSPDAPSPETAPPGRLQVRRIDLAEAAEPGLDPVSLLAALPSHRRHAFWRAPEGAAPEALLGIGAAVRLVAPTGEGPAAAVEALGTMVRDAFENRIAQVPPPPDEGDGADRGRRRALRAFFTVSFDPTDAFDGPREAARWRGFAPVEAVVPEILVRCPTAAAPWAEAILVGAESRLTELEAELDELLADAREAAGNADRDEGPGDLEIEWAAGRHRRAVEAALEALADPQLSKVVLAHGVEVRRRRPFTPAALLGALRGSYPGCFLFSFRPAAEDGPTDRPRGPRIAPPPHDPRGTSPVFLGASPERLALVGEIDEVDGVAATNGETEHPGRLRVLSGALAGTAPRGRTPEEERRFGTQLLASAKDREEHAIVEEMIAEALAPLCSELTRGGEPTLERLDNVQHLYTPVVGALRPGCTLFDAVAALHPTPAVGGMPRDRAMAAIRELEPRPRGLYAGVVGWIDAAGHGDCAVAIRSALLEAHGGSAEADATDRAEGAGRAVVYAGGGIVPTSDPDVEVEEIRLKLAAVLGAMKAPRDS